MLHNWKCLGKSAKNKSEHMQMQAHTCRIDVRKLKFLLGCLGELAFAFACHKIEWSWCPLAGFVSPPQVWVPSGCSPHPAPHHTEQTRPCLPSHDPVSRARLIVSEGESWDDCCLKCFRVCCAVLALLVGAVLSPGPLGTLPLRPAGAWQAIDLDSGQLHTKQVWNIGEAEPS